MATTLTANGYCPNFRQPNAGKILFLVIVLAILILGAAVAVGTQAPARTPAAVQAAGHHGLSAHAVEKHALSAQVNQCRNDPGHIGLILINEQTGRRATLCEFRAGEWGRIIDEADGENVTAFANDARATANEIGHAVRNLVARGYRRVEFIRGDLVDTIASALAH